MAYGSGKTPDDGGETRQEASESLEDLTAQATSTWPPAFVWEENGLPSWEPLVLGLWH